MEFSLIFFLATFALTDGCALVDVCSEKLLAATVGKDSNKLVCSEVKRFIKCSLGKVDHCDIDGENLKQQLDELEKAFYRSCNEVESNDKTWNPVKCVEKVMQKCKSEVETELKEVLMPMGIFRTNEDLHCRFFKMMKICAMDNINKCGEFAEDAVKEFLRKSSGNVSCE